MLLSGTTKLLGVIGYPIAHSLSPAMHNAALAQLGLDYVYLPLPVKPEDLEVAIAGFAAIGVQGFNVTIPHKQAVMALMSDISAIAQAVGAVNTVSWTEQGWVGTNTDVAGFIAPLQPLSTNWSQSTALVLGNGGSARAVVAGCAQLGFGQVQVAGRNAEKLAAFLHSWSASSIAVNLSVHPWDDLPALLPSADLLVNTTPLGMHPHVERSPLTASDLELLKRGAIAYDLIYTPDPTRFLQLAQASGAVAISGLEMLVQQGAAALEGWMQQPAPVEVMREALLDRLRSPK